MAGVTVPKIVFLRTGWMDRYQGLAGDKIVGGGSFVDTHGFGHEIYNFQGHDGKVYGFFQPGHKNGGLNIEELGAAAKDQTVSNVLVIWTAPNPDKKLVVVGWYRDATVFRRRQDAPPGSPRLSPVDDGANTERFGYFATTTLGNATLLPSDERILLVPTKPGGFGQASNWYARDGEKAENFRKIVLAYIENRSTPPAPATKASLPKQTDPLLRQKIEKLAVQKIVRYYENLKYIVGSVESDNLGWDLTALHPVTGIDLKLEVKGLSESTVCVQLTPNEYEKMKEHRDSYRVCVVTNTLGNPKVAIFAFSKEANGWADQLSPKSILKIDEMISARCTGVEGD